MKKSARDRRIAQAQKVLERLNFDRERTNERSALVLLALLGLRPSTPWSKATSPQLRIVDLMEWLRECYSHNYKPNTRETIRRQTLHQFVDAGLVLLNPDDPDRPINSPNSCYQITPQALKLLATHQNTDQFERKLKAYLKAQPGLRAQYERARDRRQIPVTLLDGSAVKLTPGGQNQLIKQVVEKFCPSFTPGGRVLYIGDAGKEDPIFEEKALEKLGAPLNKHGKLPDLIVHLPKKKWLVLVEAAANHGPVDGKRRAELEKIFSGVSAGLVFVSCFPSRIEMRKYLSEIAWETEVWCADNPSHLIHFNGERFLGPYP